MSLTNGRARRNLIQVIPSRIRDFCYQVAGAVDHVVIVLHKNQGEYKLHFELREAHARARVSP